MGSFSYGLALMTFSALVGAMLILCIPTSAKPATQSGHCLRPRKSPLSE
jgi:hypothetical protein